MKEADKPSEDEVRKAMQTIVNNSHEKSLNYAIEYAKMGRYMSGYDLKIQCLYILGNMSRWRGDTAKSVRDTLKKYAGVKR